MDDLRRADPLAWACELAETIAASADETERLRHLTLFFYQPSILFQSAGQLRALGAAPLSFLDRLGRYLFGIGNSPLIVKHAHKFRPVLGQLRIQRIVLFGLANRTRQNLCRVG